jgi:hypothetical protein
MIEIDWGKVWTGSHVWLAAAGGRRAAHPCTSTWAVQRGPPRPTTTTTTHAGGGWGGAPWRQHRAMAPMMSVPSRRLRALCRQLAPPQCVMPAAAELDPETGTAHASLQLPGKGATPERIAFLGAQLPPPALGNDGVQYLSPSFHRSFRAC